MDLLTRYLWVGLPRFPSPVYSADRFIDQRSALFRLTNQQRLLPDADEEFKGFLRENDLAMEPESAGNAEAAQVVYRRMSK